MKQILRLTATIAAFLWFGFANAQTRVIQGTVKDETGKSVPFMAVQVKGTTIGTYTDTAGKFSLGVDSTAKTLLLSYPGMKDQEIHISDNMLITMKTDALGLDEVVVSALGIPVEKKSIATAQQVVGSEDLNNSGTSNVMNELDGKVSGLTVISSAGDPGSGTYINLRGVTSLQGNNQPLMVVDGIPIDNSINNYDPTDGYGASGAASNLTAGVQPTNRGLDINPSDIESITVLKGPAATALYGIQAANGAIIITTKKGGKNHPGLGIEFNSSEQWSTENKLPGYQNEYGQGNNDQYAGPTGNANKKFSWGPPIDSLYWTGPQPSNAGNNYLGSYDPHGGIVVKGAPGWSPSLQQVSAYNPYDFFQTGVSADNNISFSGGTDAATFRMSLGNLTQTGVIPLSSYDKNTFNFGGTLALSKRLKLSAGVNYTNSVTDKVQQGGNTSGVMLGLLRTPPTFDNSNGVTNPANNTASYELPDPFTSERDYRGGSGYDNPYWTINQNPFTSTLNRVYGFGQADYNLINQSKTTLDLTYRVGGDTYAQDDKNAYDIGSNTIGGTGEVILANYNNTQLNSDFIATLKQTISDDLKATVILGQNYFDLTTTDRLALGTNLLVPHFLDMSNAASYQASEGEGGKRTSAEYAEAILDWKSQLFLTLTARDETSSTLPVANDVFFYPSASLAWVFTETMKMSTNKIFPYGKLRISYADVGKDAPQEGLQTYYHAATSADGWTNGIIFPFNGANGFQLSGAAGNPNLVPEQTSSFETGADLAFFDNRVSVSFTYYSEQTTNGIFSVPVSEATGSFSLLDNAAVIDNKGEEVTLNTTPVKLKNGFQWDLGFNWSHNQNEVASLSPGVSEIFLGGYSNASIVAMAGQPYGTIFGTDYVRTASGQEVIDDNPSDPGYGMPIPGSKSVALGNIQPKWIGSMNNSFSFKSFTLGVIVTTRQGGQMWDGTLGAMEYFGTASQTENRNQATTFSGVLGHLDALGNIVHNVGTGTASGAGATNAIVSSYNEYYWQNVGSSFIGPTSSNVVDASYVRISQINFGYKLPNSLVKKAHFTSVTVTLFANNPVLWTKYPGVDPETSAAGPSNAQGMDYFNNPSTKSYGVRLNLGL